MGARLLEQTFTRDKLRQALIVFFSLSPRQPPFKESSPPRSGALRKARLARQSLARLRAVLGTVTAVFVAVSVASVPAAAQVATGDWTVPRTPWGEPDLQGIWSNATTTPLQRPPELAEKEFFTNEEVSDRDARVGDARNTDRAPRAGDPGTYNEFWWERGRTVANNRTSLIVEPADGRLPPLTPEGQQRADARAQTRRERGPYDSFEDRPLAERCLIYRGVPAFPTGYNNNYHIVQAPGYVAILQEHIHSVRLIPLDGRPHIAPGTRQWLGDSRGRWEGDTLVVETTNFNDHALIRGFNGDLGDALRVVERFTRVDDDLIDYRFAVTEATTWTQPWSGSLPMTKIPGPMYEYACHEGNYALGNVLGGARAQERPPK